MDNLHIVDTVICLLSLLWLFAVLCCIFVVCVVLFFWDPPSFTTWRPIWRLWVRFIQMDGQIRNPDVLLVSSRFVAGSLGGLVG